MVIVVVAVVVVAAALAWQLRTVSSARDAAVAEAERLQTAVDAAEAERVVAAAERASALESAEAARERETRAKREAAEVAGRVGELTATIDTLRADLGARELVITDLRAEVAAAHASSASPRAEVLWLLELARIERTWRESVAPDPSQPSGILDAEDPVQAALAIDAAAAREEIGTHVEVRAKGIDASDPELALTAVRVVQEAIAEAARDVEDLVIELVEDDGAVVVTVDGDGESRAVETLETWKTPSGYRI